MWPRKVRKNREKDQKGGEVVREKVSHEKKKKNEIERQKENLWKKQNVEQNKEKLPCRSNQWLKASPADSKWFWEKAEWQE